MVIGRTEAMLETWYARVGSWTGSVLIALVLFVAAFLYVDGGFRPLSHGLEFAALSEAPFDLDQPNRFRTRILGPLIGWFLHLRGDLFVVVPWIFFVGFLAVMNVWCMKAGTGTTLALAVTMALAFSPVLLHTLAVPGFTDGVCYFFVALAFMRVQDTFLSCVCMALAVSTHESVLFLLPAWSIALGWKERWKGRGFKRIVLVLVMLLPYFVYRWWVLHHDDQTLAMGFYLSRENLANCISVGPLATAFGTFGTYRFHWLVIGIPFLLLGWRSAFVRWSLLLIASVSATLIIAFDTTRMMCWTFPMLIPCMLELKGRVGRDRAVTWMMLAWALNFLIPAYTTTGAGSFRLDEIRSFVVG